MACSRQVKCWGARIALIGSALLLTGCGPMVGLDAAAPDDAGTIHDAAATHDAAVAHDAATTNDATASDQAAPGDAAADAGAAVLHLISAEQLHDMLASKDFLLIDVRGGTPASQIPQTDATILYSDTSALATYLGGDLDTRAVLYCASGGRSGSAGNALVALGYRAIYSLSGGITAWSSLYPTVTPGADGG